MTIRRLNYTGRQRIRRDDVVVTLAARDGGPPTISVLLDLESYSLPESALVSVEAYRRTWLRRIPLGPVSTVGVGELGPFDLEGIHDAAGVKFRVKVSTTQPAEERGQLLAAADRLSPEAGKDTPEEVVSLLPVQEADLGDVVWRVDCDPAEGPVLQVNRQLGRLATREPQFRALVLTAALQQVMDAARLIGGRADDIEDDEGDWRGDWLRFGRALAGPWPRTTMDHEEWTEWCATVAKRFATRHRFQQMYSDWSEERES